MSSDKTPSTKKRSKTSDAGFSAYKRKTWRKVSLEMNSPSMEQCLREVERRWEKLADDQRTPFRSNSKRNIFCLCQKPYSDQDPTMVGCDICGNWFHITCINTTEEFVNVVNFYHCEKCVRSKYLDFAQYCYHFGSDLLENRDIIAIGEKWQTKSPALQTAIGSHQYLTPNEYDAALHKHSRILSKRGLANPYNNCWLNVILHVVCGTFYYDLVNTMTEAKDNISQCLVEIHNHLTRQQANKGGRPSLPDSAVQLSSAVNCDLKAREQKDVCDFYDELVLHLLKKSQNQQAEHLLQTRFLNLRTCQCCYTHEGHTAILNYLTVKVLQTSQIVQLESLIWEKCNWPIFDSQRVKRLS